MDWERLPVDVLVMILGRTSAHDVASLAAASRAMHSLARHPKLLALRLRLIFGVSLPFLDTARVAAFFESLHSQPRLALMPDNMLVPLHVHDEKLCGGLYETLSCGSTSGQACLSLLTCKAPEGYYSGFCPNPRSWRGCTDFALSHNCRNFSLVFGTAGQQVRPGDKKKSGQTERA